MRLLGPVYPHLYVGPAVCEAVVFWVTGGRSSSPPPPPPPHLHSMGFRQLRIGLLPLQTTFRLLRRPKGVITGPNWVLLIRVDPSESWSSCRRPAKDLQTPGDLQTPSLGRPKWVLLVLRRPKGVLRRPKGVLIVQSRPQWVLLVMQTPSLGRPKWVLLVLRRPKGVLRRPKGVLRRPKRVLRRPKRVLRRLKGVLRRPRGVLIVQSRPQWVLEDDQQDVAQGSALPV